jgi:hypothetical protein
MELQENAGKRALVIIHLSSLDSFTEEYGFANGAYVASQLCAAIQAHDGLVVVVDQGWEFNGEKSDPRQLVLKALEKHSQVVWFSHTEETLIYSDQWGQPMQQLGALLRDRGVTSIVLGGCYASEDEERGCVNAARKAIAAQGFACQIDKDLCGFEEEDEE